MGVDMEELRSGTIGRYGGVQFNARPGANVTAALTAIASAVGGAGGAIGKLLAGLVPDAGFGCAAFEKLNYRAPGPRKVASNSRLVREIRAAAVEKRLRKRRKRLRDAMRSAEGQW